MRPHQRLPPTNLRSAEPAEGGQERRGFRRFAQRTSIADLRLVTPPGQRGIDARELRLETGHSPPTTVDQLDAHRGKLLVPGREPALVRQPLLQELVSPDQDLTVADECRPVTGIQPGREAVEEVAPGHRRAVQDFQVLPAEGHGPRPGAVVTGALPGAVFQAFDRPADGSSAGVAMELTRQRGLRRPPERNLPQTRGSK